MEIQSVIFPKKKYSATKAKQWLKKKKLKPIKKVDKTINFLRYRIRQPKYKKYITKKIPNGISLILGIT